MTKITQGFAQELPKLLEQVDAGLSQEVGSPVVLDASEQEIRPVSELIAGMPSGAVCCRARFIKNVNVSGIGGILIPLECADVLARGSMRMEPRGSEPLRYEGLVDGAMRELWSGFIRSWNRAASPDYRLSADVAERSVELYPHGIEIPRCSGIFPEALRLQLRLAEQTFACALFIPSKVVQGSAVRGFEAPATFVAGSVAGGTAPADAPAPHPTKPVVFLDYTGLVLPWLRLKASDPRLRYVLSESADPKQWSAGAEPPVAAVLAGIDLGLLERLGACSLIEIRPRE